ncbi:MAG: ANTAR domain-containing protein [Chitinispirillales bacterium]|jgi:response regulator NasT|nr:ANTAR domain-containing protein [Chitinispirillales bacterium]
MENALIVSDAEKSAVFFTEILKAASCENISVLHSAEKARRLIMERDFDLAIINVPLIDESGENLARHIASKNIAQVILVVQSEFFDEVSAITENDGILVVAKPVDKTIFWSVLKLAQSAQSRLKKMQIENGKLRQKIEDMRVIDRAKLILVSNLKMSEIEAHRFIGKQAMDVRSTRIEIAKGILKTYDG